MRGVKAAPCNVRVRGRIFRSRPRSTLCARRRLPKRNHREAVALGAQARAFAPCQNIFGKIFWQAAGMARRAQNPSFAACRVPRHAEAGHPNGCPAFKNTPTVPLYTKRMYFSTPNMYKYFHQRLALLRIDRARGAWYSIGTTKKTAGDTEHRKLQADANFQSPMGTAPGSQA